MGIDRFAYALRLLGIRQRVRRDQPLHHAARLGYRHQQERMRGEGQQFHVPHKDRDNDGADTIAY